MSANIRDFGITQAGERVEAIDLTGSGLRTTILTLGATVQDLRLEGADWPLVLGADTPDAYQGPLLYAGAIVGPVANRIAGASATIAGKRYEFEANEGGRTTLHSGATGLHARLWQIESATANEATLCIDLADGDGGFPGNRSVTACFRLIEPGDLVIELRATTDAPSPINLAHHGYWTLDGTPDTRRHRLRVAADHYLPVDAELIPTGEARPVAGTEFDLRHGRLLTDAPPLDHNFCLAMSRRDLTEVADLFGASGIRLRLATTEPGLHVYDGRHFTPGPGRRGLNPHAGIALEAQGWPDAPNHPGFPTVTLAPGEIYRQITRFRIDRPDKP
ncbi:aldose epimerase family protein [Defluviimonas sp. SAOS-178_SWC]|uniref:aldose epimerase family protein n=1 Tax=Defluviimonas sp. SAOS-178_SWC TaxID=3121287 RepID=UPI0032218A12